MNQEEQYQQAILLLKYVNSRKQGQTAEEFLKETGLSPGSEMWKESVRALKYAEQLPLQHILRQANTMLESLGTYSDSVQKASEVREKLNELELSTPMQDSEEIQIAPVRKRTGILIPLLLLCVVGTVSGVILASSWNPAPSPNPVNTASSVAESSSRTVPETEKQTETVPETEKQTETVPSTEDAVLTIVSWTDVDLANMFEIYRKYYPDAQVKYQNCGVSSGALASVEYASYLNSGDDADLFVTEADWTLNYINNDEFSAPLSHLGITAAEYENAYPYTLEVGTNASGDFRAATWQCCPGCYAYNTDLAETYLGITSPEQMQNKISDWNLFAATAEELRQATSGTVTMTATIGGIWQAYSTGRNAAWVENQTIQTDTAREFTAMIKNYVDSGYVNPEIKQWSEDWTKTGLSQTTLGYFYSSWCLGYGAQLEQNGGDDGNWRVVAGPQEFFWGGSWLCLSPNCNSPTEAARFIRAFTTNEECMKDYALYSGDFVNNKNVMKTIVENGLNSNPLLGGQDQFSVLYQSADKIQMGSSITRYDQNLKNTFIDTLETYITYDTDTIISRFITQALSENPDLNA